jgi:hypothetical protein
MLSGLGLRPSTGEDRVPTDEENYAQFVEKSISDLADNARAEGRDRQAPARRTPAVPELVALGLAVVAFVVALLA